MSFIFDLNAAATVAAKIAIAVLAIIAIVVVCAIFSSTVGCNGPVIEDAARKIFQFNTEIEEIEQGIWEDKSKLNLVPLTDVDRANLEAKIENDENTLKRLQVAKGKAVKTKEAAHAADDAMIDDAASVAMGLLPIGFGGSLIALLASMGKGYLRTRTFKGVLRSVQPVIDLATEDQRQAIRDTQTEAEGKMVNKLQVRKTPQGA